MGYHLKKTFLLFLSVTCSLCWSMNSRRKRSASLPVMLHRESAKKFQYVPDPHQILVQKWDRLLLIKGIQEKNFTHVVMIVRKAINSCGNNDWCFQVLKDVFGSDNVYTIFIQHYCHQKNLLCDRPQT